MSWIEIDMRHEDRRVTKLANYELGAVLAKALGDEKRRRRCLGRAEELRRKLVNEGVIKVQADGS